MPPSDAVAASKVVSTVADTHGSKTWRVTERIDGALEATEAFLLKPEGVLLVSQDGPDGRHAKVYLDTEEAATAVRDACIELLAAIREKRDST